MLTIQAAGVIVFRDTNTAEKEFLLLRSTKGFWDFPKGKQDPGETVLETALRELDEETGLEVSLIDENPLSISWNFTRDNTQYHKTCFYFVGAAQQDCTAVLSAEHTEYRWLTYQQALNTIEHETSKTILRQVHAKLDLLRN